MKKYKPSKGCQNLRADAERAFADFLEEPRWTSLNAYIMTQAAFQGALIMDFLKPEMKKRRKKK